MQNQATNRNTDRNTDRTTDRTTEKLSEYAEFYRRLTEPIPTDFGADLVPINFILEQDKERLIVFCQDVIFFSQMLKDSVEFKQMAKNENDPIEKGKLTQIYNSAFTTLWQSMRPLVEQAKIIIQKNIIPDE